MTNSFFGGMPQQKGVAPQATPSPTQSLNNQVDPIKRAKFSGYLEGMSANAMPQQPPMTPMMPPQTPMPMMGGGEIDVFDPMYMNQGGFVIQTDDSGKIATRPVYDAEKGRMVSQILSRGMVDEMKQAAQKPMVTVETPTIVESEPESKLISVKDIIQEDESAKGVPYYPNIDRQDVQISLPKSRPISLPVSKPMIQLPVSRPRIPDLPVGRPMPDVPVGRPAPSVDPFDDARRLIALADTGKFNRFGGGVERQALRDKPIEAIYDEATGDYTFKEIDEPKLTIADLLKEYDDEELRDAAEYLVTSPRTPVKKRDVDFVLDDLALYQETPYKYEYSYDPSGILNRGSQEEKDQGIGLLAKIINLLRPRYTTESAGFEEIGGEEEFPPSDVIRSSRFNDGGIVQGFGKGGAISGARRKSDFSTNISGNVSGRLPRSLQDTVNRIKSEQMKDARDDDTFDAMGGFGGATYAGRDDPYREDRSTPTIAPKEFTDLRNVQSSTPLTIGNLPTMTSQGAPDNMFGFNRFTKPIIDMLRYDTSTPAGAGEYYADTARSLARYEQDQIKRKKDQDRAEAKLAEEQRLRDMIAGMMPQQTPITPDPIVDPSPPTIPSDPSDVVIPSTRIPNFDIANLSPYPTFGVPGTGTYPAVISSGITPELLRNLFTMQGVPTTAMQEGGSVNKLDTAIDDFLGSMRSVA